ncbi:glycosyltransferase family 2 protein [Salmonirosea aquatica]|uniref:Glycosyltransferase n=1 Tax=Salmonirosea aquatica TaxID=2654236 RepID=A0A7C9FRC3_9BACT|nr:glycosyltransferase [Cytophagaceae bacterium SJW1-29]
MISFIVIGRNIGLTAEICFNSLFQSVQYAALSDYEILYIDSSSTDNTLEIIKRYTSVQVFRIEENYNAAVARNVGAQEAKGDYLIFLDGDMEIQPEFLKSRLLDSLGQPKYDYVSGDLINYFYKNNTFQFITKAPYFGNMLSEEKTESVVGGLFAITKETFQSVSGMNIRYKMCEDYDFGLRLAQKNILLKRLNAVFVNHHTVSYIDVGRMKRMMRSGDFLFVGLLNREHFLNPHFWKVFIRNSYSCICFFLCLCLILFTGPIGLFPYLLLISAKSTFQRISVNHSFFNYFLYFLLRDIQELAGTFFFFPKKKKPIVYKPILFDANMP